MKEYITPDFDVTIYKIEDIITASGNNTSEDVTITPNDPDGEDWMG